MRDILFVTCCKNSNYWSSNDWVFQGFQLGLTSRISYVTNCIEAERIRYNTTTPGVYIYYCPLGSKSPLLYNINLNTGGNIMVHFTPHSHHIS